MESVLGIFASIDDPRDHTAQYELPALLFIALAATSCGAKSCVDIADFAEGNRAELTVIVELQPTPRPATTHSAVCSGCSILNRWRSRCTASARPCAWVSAWTRRKAPWRWMANASVAPTNAAAQHAAVDGRRLGRRDPPVDRGARLDRRQRGGGDAGGAEDGGAERLYGHRRRLALPSEMARTVRAQGGHSLLKLKGNHGPDAAHRGIIGREERDASRAR